MEKNKHAFDVGDWVSAFYANSVVRIEEITDEGYKTNNERIPFIRFDKEYSFVKVHMSDRFLSMVQDGDVLSWDPETYTITNLSRLERVAKPRPNKTKKDK